MSLIRSEGTFTGPFGSGNTVLPPNGKSYKSGPEAISVTFNKKVVTSDQHQQQLLGLPSFLALLLLHFLLISIPFNSFSEVDVLIITHLLLGTSLI